jgi:hypothetical protein
MPSRTFAFERGGEKRLKLSSTGFFGDLMITLDGQLLGSLSKGQVQEYKLPDGSTLYIRRAYNFFEAKTVLLRDGKPLPGSDTDPWQITNTAVILIYIFGGVHLLFGLIEVLFDTQRWIRESGTGYEFMIFGLVLLPLGFFIKRSSVIALLSAMIMIIAGAVILPLITGYPYECGYIFMCLFFLSMLFQSYLSLRKIPKSERQ